MTQSKTNTECSELLSAATQAQPGLLRFLEEMVAAESPSDNKQAVDRCVTLVAKRCTKQGGRVKLHRQRGFGDLLEVRFGPSSRKQKPLMLLGHLDTVWPLGTLKEMPFRVKDRRVWGPGVLDMKAGVAMALTALRMLDERGWLRRPILMLLNSDEEVGSTCSRALTEKLALQSESVFVLEPAQGLEGAYKTARKGVGEYRVQVHGVAAHSGVDFERGASAINELARQIGAIEGFTELARGITVNAGIVQGGTRSNVIAADAWADVDVRIARAGDAARIEKRFRGLRVVDRRCSLEVTGGMNRPPMERTRGTVELFRRAATLAGTMGFDLHEAATGGGSDGNFTSALGVATLDGMGAVGEGAHARHESILLENLAPRTALLAAMLLTNGTGKRHTNRSS
jgi:glutamate carboxypeptidase